MTISVKQFAFLTFLIMIGQKLIILPAFLMNSSGRDGYISLLVMLLLELVIVAAIMFSIKRTDKSFFELLDKGLGKIGGRIIAAVMLVAMLIKILLVISIIRIFFNSIFEQNLRDWLSIAAVCFLMFFIASKSLRGIGRLGEIIFPLVVFACLALAFLSIKNFRPSLLLPILEGGVRPVFSNLWIYPLWFLDIAVMVVFVGRVKGRVLIEGGSGGKKHLMKAGLIAAGAASLVALFLSLVLFMNFGDVPHLLDYRTNVSGLLLFSSSSYRYGRYDIPLFCLFILSLFVVLGLFFYSFVRHVSYIVKTDKHTNVAAVGSVGIFVTLLAFFNAEHTLFSFSIGWVRFFGHFNNILVPLLVLVLAVMVSKKINKDKDVGISKL